MTEPVPTHPPVRPDGVQPTGPVDVVPAPPGAAGPPPAPLPPRAAASPPDGRRPSRAPRPPHPPSRRAARLGTVLGLLGFLLLSLGLAIGADTGPYWRAVPLWSLFATVAGLVTLLPFLRAGRLRPDAAWAVAAAGLTGLAAFWVLVVLPRVDSDRGLVLTLALAASGAALWVAPDRRR